MFNLDNCVIFITNNASKQMQKYFNERLVKLGSTRVQWIALYYLGKRDSISQVELSKKMNIRSSTVVRLIDRMERDGYVRRVKDIHDRRVTSIKLTDSGLNLREQLLPEGQKVNDIFCKDITQKEFKTFIHVLNKMVDNINEK